MAAKAGTAEVQGRKADRLRVDAPARLRPNSWSSVEAQVLDLSSLGFRARCEARVLAGAGISLDIDGIGSVDAQVEWRRGDEFGARFFQPIDLQRCRWGGGEAALPLARLLVERAAAKAAGRKGAEAAIRRQILSALPMHKVAAKR